MVGYSLIPNNLRSSPHSALGDFQTTIFIRRTPFQIRLISAPKTGASAGNQKKRDDKHQASRRKDQRNQNAKPQRYRAPTQPTASAATKPHICRTSSRTPVYTGERKSVQSERLEQRRNFSRAGIKKARIPLWQYPSAPYFFCSSHSFRGFNSS
ncbi:hypothetical protein SDC9_180194 [bioreactor metagenome]|uniref:Uncharacterized protein n=1 Tax=bioreactor metagenome TaxID=1076179 RepID=A0A645H8X3_9ZZZZ